jgi:hypothetical protein
LLTLAIVAPRQLIGSGEEAVRLSFVSCLIIIASAVVGQFVAAAETH